MLKVSDSQVGGSPGYELFAWVSSIHVPNCHIDCGSRAEISKRSLLLHPLSAPVGNPSMNMEKTTPENGENES